MIINIIWSPASYHHHHHHHDRHYHMLQHNSCWPAWRLFAWGNQGTQSKHLSDAILDLWQSDRLKKLLSVLKILFVSSMALLTNVLWRPGQNSSSSIWVSTWDYIYSSWGGRPACKRRELATPQLGGRLRQVPKSAGFCIYVLSFWVEIVII